MINSPPASDAEQVYNDTLSRMKAASPPEHARRGTILAVDDRPRNLELLRDVLSEEGYEVIEALSGGQALECVARKLPDLILLDVIMPDMDGYEVCRRLKSNPATADVPVIFLSADSGKDSVIRGIEVGGVDYVTKPFTKAELVARVNTHVTLRRLLDHNHKLLQERQRLLAEEAEDIKRPLRAIAQNLGEIAHILHPAPEQVVRLINDTLMLANDALSQLNRDFESGIRHAPDASQLEFPACSEKLLELMGHWYQRAHSRRIDFKIHRPSREIAIACHLSQLGYLIDLLMSSVVNGSTAGDAIEVRIHPATEALEVSVEYAMPSRTNRTVAEEQAFNWLAPSPLAHPMLHEAERLGAKLRFGAYLTGHQVLVLALPLHAADD